MDPLNIEAEPNYLRDGNIYVIPSVILNPKDEKGNFPSDIKDTSLFPKRKLFKLINATHSRDDPHFEYMAELVNDQLVFMFETQIPGELYLTSNYFKNNTFKIKIKNGEIVPESIEALRIKEEIMSDNYVRFKIIAKDKYGRLIYLEQSDLDKLEMTVKYPNNTIIKEDMQYISDIKSKSVIIYRILYMAGETTFQFKYNNQSIICNNCSSYPKYNEFDFNNSKVEYNKEINLGENISLSLSPKDVYNNKLPAKEIINKLVIDCLINNKTIIKINSYLDEEKNIINITNGEIITQPGNLSLIISYNYKEIKFEVKVIEHTILDKTKFYVKTNTSINEIKGNNSIINAGVENDFEIIVLLSNIYGNKLQVQDDSAKITEAKLYGNDMDPILFDKSRNENEFNLTIPISNTEDFRYLVSGDNYEVHVQLLKGNQTVDFYFRINLTSQENDKGYGNGMYNISHFTIEPNEIPFQMSAGIKYEFYLQVRTKKDLLYHRELDINKHLNYSLSLEDKSFIFNALNINSTLGIFLIELYSTIQSENELTLIFDKKEYNQKFLIKIESNPLPNANNSELLNYTEEIKEDIEPIKMYILLRDDYNNEFINRKDVMFKKQLFILSNDEKPEQNIEIGPDNKTFILNFVSDYHKELFNLSVVFENSNNLILIRNNIIVKSKVTKFLEPEELVIPIQYKPGKVFFYKTAKMINVNFGIENQTETQDQMIEANGNYLLYIRDINYEKGENNTKVILYTGYLAILSLTNKNETIDEQYFIYDNKLINIYNQIKNNSGENSSLPLIENVNETIGFIKIEFYENGNIKQMYYPKDKRFNMLSIDYIREVAELIIPKISSQLFSDNIYEKLDDILKDIDQNKTSTDSPKEIRMRQIRRLAELTPKKVKNKKKKICY